MSPRKPSLNSIRSLIRLREGGRSISFNNDNLSLISSATSVMIGVTTSIRIRIRNYRRLQSALKGRKRSLIRTERAWKRGAIRVPNTPG